MTESLYTLDELKEKIKAIDTKLEKAVSRSELNTTQNAQSFAVEVQRLQEQRDYYWDLLNQQTQSNNKSSLVTLVRCPGYRRWTS